MITRETIIEKLSQKYPQYRFIPTDVTKNGDVHLKGICIRDDSPIAPTIYTDSIIARSDGNLDKAIEIISNIIEQQQAIDIDLAMLQDRDFILERIRIGVQKESDEKLLKHPVKEFPGMEAYLYFAEHSDNRNIWSIKLNSELLASANISEEIAWEVAEKNTFAATTLQSLSSVLTEMLGDGADDNMFDMLPCEMYVISNKEKVKGAASILNHELLKSFAKEHDCSSICVLLSSLHEAILVPLQGEYNIEDFNAMVCEINATELSPEDVLVNRAYVINFEE